MYKNALGVIYFVTVICSLQAELLEGLYCGKDNCYELLGVAKNSSRNEIARSYRKLAKKYHPDLQRNANAKKEAEEQFKIIATAYEILKDDESRVDYDYMLDNPDAYYAHYYRYYRRRVAPKVDVRIVIFVTISVISIIQYYSAWQRYDTAIKYFMNVPKYRNRALDIAKQDGLIQSERKSKRSKTEQKDELDRIIQKVIEDKMDIKGAYARPSLFDVLWVQLLIFPYTLAKYIYWYTSWIWNHTVLHQPYNEEEKLYLIRKYLKLGKHQFDSLEDEKRDEYLRRELWIREKFEIWRKEEEENMKKQLADSAKFKQYRRYIKNHGVSRMTFDDS